MKRLLIIIILIFSVPAVLYSQTASDSIIPKIRYRRGVIYEVKTRGGMVYVGAVKGETADILTLEDRKTLQLYEIRKKEIISAKILSDREAYENVMGENYHSASYMFSSSSLLYEKPRMTVNTQWLIMDNFSYALNTNWDITMNSVLLYPASVGVKCAYEVGRDTYFGANVFAAWNPSQSTSSASELFIGYGALARVTHGNTHSNFSVSGGLLGLNNEILQQSSTLPFYNLPFGCFAFSRQFREKWSFTGEMFYFPEERTGFLGLGIKFLEDEETSWTFGCYTYVSMQNNNFSINRQVLPLPYLGYSRNIFKN